MTADGERPHSVEALVDHLESSGFRLVSDDDGGMGGVQLIYTGVFDEVPAEVEIYADRGHWQALLKLNGMAKFHTPDVWAAYLDGTEVGEHDIAYEAAFIRERGAEAATAVRRDPDAERKVVEAGQAYMERWYEENSGDF